MFTPTDTVGGPQAESTSFQNVTLVEPDDPALSHIHTDAAESHFDPPACEWEADEQWQQCYDYYMDIAHDPGREVMERAQARFTMYRYLEVTHPFEESDSPWWSRNNPEQNPNCHQNSQTSTAPTSTPQSDGEQSD